MRPVIRRMCFFLITDNFYMFQNRTYRQHHQKKGLVSFEITVKETNLNIQADKELSKEAVRYVLEVRNQLEAYIKLHPEFATTLLPYKDNGLVPEPIHRMIDAGRLVNVGPMAAVAGMVAQYTGEKLLSLTHEVLVENGGDIFVKSDTDTVFSIFAGKSPFSMVTGIKIKKQETPYGLCTSSGTVGHSKSFGTADAVAVLSNSCTLADAAATALCNRVKARKDIESVINAGKAVPGLRGIVIIKGDAIGAWGDLELVSL